MHKSLWTLLLCTFFLMIGGCGESKQDASQKAMEEWLEQADLNAQESPEQLYQAALQEETLIVYSDTTRIYDVKDTFEAAYPGLTVTVYDTRAYDMIEALCTAYETQSLNCDIIICSDDNAQLSSQLLPLHIVNKYVPWDIAPFLKEEADDTLLYFLAESNQLFYNPSVYSECPIDNWWEMTEPAWYGNVYMNSPLRSMPAYALVHGVIANSDKMALAYEARYGKPLEIPKGSCAGKVFWQKLADNGLRFTTSSNEIVELVGTSGQDKPPLGFMISSKIRRTSVGLQVAAAYGVAPCDGVYSANSVSIVGGSKNVNSAKLFIRWLLGEADGTGEGLKPYMLEGTWPIRTDIPNYASVPLEQGEFWYNDKGEVAAQNAEIMEFWTQLQEQTEKATAKEVK